MQKTPVEQAGAKREDYILVCIICPKCRTAYVHGGKCPGCIEHELVAEKERTAALLRVLHSEETCNSRVQLWRSSFQALVAVLGECVDSDTPVYLHNRLQGAYKSAREFDALKGAEWKAPE